MKKNNLFLLASIALLLFISGCSSCLRTIHERPTDFRTQGDKILMNTVWQTVEYSINGISYMDSIRKYELDKRFIFTLTQDQKGYVTNRITSVTENVNLYPTVNGMKKCVLYSTWSTESDNISIKRIYIYHQWTCCGDATLYSFPVHSCGYFDSLFIPQQGWDVKLLVNNQMELTATVNNAQYIKILQKR